MRITIFGSGYVGLVTGACLADAGNHVLCVDVDEQKTSMLHRGEVPIHEPGLDALVRRGADAGRLRFSTNAQEGVDHGLFQLIAVGTPRGPARIRVSAGMTIRFGRVSAPSLSGLKRMSVFMNRVLPRASC